MKRLRQLIKPPIRELLAVGKELTDLKLDNFHYIEGPSARVMAFDFGDVYPRRPGDVDELCKESITEVEAFKRSKSAKKWFLRQA